MKRLSKTCAVAAALFAFACAGMWSAPPAGAQGQGAIVLFDGKNLDNFNKVGDANWRIEDGAVVADKGVGFLVSKNAYADYQLRIEFWADDDVNSGIYMRCSNPAEPTDKTCYEANIYDKRPDPTFGTGAIVHLGKVEPTHKVGGKWNTYEIPQRGPRSPSFSTARRRSRASRTSSSRAGPSPCNTAPAS